MNDNTYFDIIRSYNNGQMAQCKKQIKRGGKKNFILRLIEDSVYFTHKEKLTIIKKIL